MTIQVVPILDATIGVDCYQPLSAGDCRKLAASVYLGRPVKFVGRYVENLTGGEIENIIQSGLGLFTIGVAHTDSMKSPSPGLGSRDGLSAVTRLRTLEIPTGVTHVLDVEGTTSATKDEVSGYVNSATDVISRQTEPALYVGWGDPLSSDDLYYRLSVKLYWLSSPSVRGPSHRGPAMIQRLENIKLADILVDIDEASNDLLGGQFHMMVDA